MSKKHKHIFSSSECVSSEMLKAYLEGKLNDDQKREVEKHLVDCPMCNDELEGLEQFSSILSAEKAVSELDQRIEQRFGKAKRKTPVITYVSAAAAAILVLIVSGYLIISNLNTMQEGKIAQEVDMEDNEIQPKARDNAEVIEKHLKEETGKDQKTTKTPAENQSMPLKRKEKAEKEMFEVAATAQKEITEDDIVITETLSASRGQETESSKIEEMPVESDGIKQKKGKGERPLTIVMDEENYAVDNKIVVEEVTSKSTVSSTEKGTSKKLFQSSEKAKAQQEVPIDDMMYETQEETIDFFTMGKFAFENEDYSNAKNLMDQAIAYQNKGDSAYYFYAISCYHQGEYDTALENLQKIESAETFRYERKWFLANILIQKDSPDKAIPLLKELVESNTKFTDKANIKLDEITNDQ